MKKKSKPRVAPRLGYYMAGLSEAGLEILGEWESVEADLIWKAELPSPVEGWRHQLVVEWIPKSESLRYAPSIISKERPGMQLQPWSRSIWFNKKTTPDAGVHVTASMDLIKDGLKEARSWALWAESHSLAESRALLWNYKIPLEFGIFAGLIKTPAGTSAWPVHRLAQLQWRWAIDVQPWLPRDSILQSWTCATELLEKTMLSLYREGSRIDSRTAWFEVTTAEFGRLTETI